MKNFFCILALTALVVAACKKEEPQPVDEVEQLEKDLEKIDNYLVEQGLADDTLHHPTKIRYIIEAEGTGLTPRYGEDSMIVSYTGRLLDTGKVFDSNDSARFKLNDDLILGWQIMLQEMQEGDKYTLYLPSFFGYGKYGKEPDIPPHAVLIFEIELLVVYQ